ncbi:PTS ascorbate transporter subunit IIC [[Mycoplasma] testudinis]|uniref:PTS ascorbate transporter subunit IIC n=1 Tax=[Mycoplasma] testudinis TaxID=33924 RepID=UPI0006964CFA|nr:PTS ascorbate transporter subunit IIC [[Mycoplasma] testudinis]
MGFNPGDSIEIDAGTWFLTFFKDFIGTPAILIGLFAMIGSLLLRKKATDVLLSLFKTMAGFLILGGGAGVLSGALANFQVLFVDLFGVNGVIPNNDAFAGQLFAIAPQIAQLGSIIMVVSMILNLLLAYTSRFKYVFLSGHVLFYMSLMLSGVMVLSGFDLNNAADYATALIASAVIMSIYMVVSCAATKRWVSRITKTNDITVAHTGSIGYVMSGLIGDLIYRIKKGKIKYTEEINFPKWLLFFRNTFASMAITMLIVFSIVFIPEGIMYQVGYKVLPVENATELANLFGPNAARNWLVQDIVDAFTFAAGVEIMLFGVRMIIGEIVPSFKGISDKWIKNSKAGLDCPIVFPYAPNAVLIGFLSSFAAGLIGIAITIGFASDNTITNIIAPVIIPGIVAHFFLGATSGVFGNSRGGIWGAIVGPFIHGLIITFVPVIFVVANWSPSSSLTWGDSDYLLGVVPGVLAYRTLIDSNISAARGLVLAIPIVIYVLMAAEGIFKSAYLDKKQLTYKTLFKGRPKTLSV